MEVIEHQLPITNSSIPTRTLTTCVNIVATLKALSWLSTLTRFHAGYFRISLSLCGQALLWKILREPRTDDRALRPVVLIMPSAAFFVLWSLALFSLVALCLLYIMRCLFRMENIKAELSHHVGMNYLFAPWISWLLLLESTPFLHPKTTSYHVLWWVLSVPIVVLDVKIYGQWFTNGKKLLSMAANPASQISVIGNLVGARVAARMGWSELAMCMFSLGLVHYLVLFVTLYQRFVGSDSLPAMLRPVFFLFIAAPSMASLAWDSISSTFDITSKMLFFLSLFLFASLNAMVPFRKMGTAPSQIAQAEMPQFQNSSAPGTPHEGVGLNGRGRSADVEGKGHEVDGGDNLGDDSGAKRRDWEGHQSMSPKARMPSGKPVKSPGRRLGELAIGGDVVSHPALEHDGLELGMSGVGRCQVGSGAAAKWGAVPLPMMQRWVRRALRSGGRVVHGRGGESLEGRPRPRGKGKEERLESRTKRRAEREGGTLGGICFPFSLR